MTEYIDREAAIKALCERSEPCFTESGEPTFKGDYIGAIASVPAADVVEVKHGHWIEEDGYQICSECGEEHHWIGYRASYCDVCGAKMDGGGKE